ncbi:unnamed protein product [Linum trigynum]|uniref:Major facilitator superfamily (MFS) profile domain-containing protein n=1 Tax=Linum trigynum TaxID=586398 RepID=A0AAV2EVQ4_9ROSI
MTRFSIHVKRYTVLLACAACQSSLLCGYEISMSLVSNFIKQDLDMKAVDKACFVDTIQLVSVLTMVPSGALSDWIGRRPLLIIVGMSAFVGYFVMTIASSVSMLIIGRMLSLLGVGLALPTTPLYIAEIATPKVRGFLNCTPEVLSIFGSLLALLNMEIYSSVPHHISWRVIIGFGMVPSGILAIRMFWLPESPQWLIHRGRIAETSMALSKTASNGSLASARLNELKLAAKIPVDSTANIVVMSEETDPLALYQFFRNPQQPRFKVIVSVLYLSIMQQICGVDVIISNFVKGVIPMKNQIWSRVLVALVKLLITLVPMLGVDKIGRKPLLLVSFVLITIASAVLGFSHLEDGGTRFFLFVLIAGYALGLGPITAVYSTEVLPFKTRAQVLGLGM